MRPPLLLLSLTATALALAVPDPIPAPTAAPLTHIRRTDNNPELQLNLLAPNTPSAQLAAALSPASPEAQGPPNGQGQNHQHPPGKGPPPGGWGKGPPPCGPPPGSPGGPPPGGWLVMAAGALMGRPPPKGPPPGFSVTATLVITQSAPVPPPYTPAPEYTQAPAQYTPNGEGGFVTATQWVWDDTYE
ncbi:hypothetical protein EJ06DRAFT_520951 [Trichodelitschia bisporula]|uniref:Uncharacterized protein n=1 Tax=Trichodelitschia bisporula TaxID=703511 RepID=A0A6G1I1Y3_9PEZI|nr:hypothetical protein EJ06DRAFT_520951 [Trichodelitschia bisporula]